jgi:hypothetical protein
MAESPAPASRSRQITSLVALIVVLAGVIWFQFFRTAGPKPAASNSVTARPDRNAAGPLPVPETVRLAELKDTVAFSEAGRDPFSFGARPAPPAPPPESLPAASAPAPAPVIPAPPPGPPPIALRLIGITVPPGAAPPLVTLKDPISGASFEASEGQIVDGRYRVVKVGERSVVLSYVDGTGMRTVALGG